MRIRFAFAAVLATATVATWGIATSGEDDPRWNDPISQWANIHFSHKLHIEDAEAECADCHGQAQSSRTSDDLLLPTHADCESCHDVEEESECATCHSVGKPIEGFAAPQREISFDHQFHIEERGLECSACHAGVEASEAPSHAFLPRMDTCTTCHDGGDAPQSCESCHRGLESLLPRSHEKVDWAREHKRLARMGDLSNDCAACHSESQCQVCHVGPTLQLTRDELVRIVPEFRPDPSGERALALESVHDLNYVFTHPLDVRSKKTDCASCHDQQKFCTSCHELNQDAGFSSPLPPGHEELGFVRLGVGSGGGKHAQLARREIESCTACHDVEGRDPVCITCHVDRSPGLGNDPKTHSRSFRDDQGEWHSNPGAVCFNCHTDTQSAGIGFCGYCHGVVD